MMMRTSILARRALVLAACVALTGGCWGGSDSQAPQPVAVEAEQSVLDDAMLAQTWQVRMADDATRAPFESQAGWAQFFQRDLGQALGAFASDPAGRLGVARSHTELAALYRQAALLAGRSALRTYGDLHVDEDPAGADYLVAVGAIFDGDSARADVALTALGEAGPPELVAAASNWRSWVADGAVWPPDEALVAVPSVLGEVISGQIPSVPRLPHYQLPERTEEARLLDVGDPSTLYLLSRWHEAAARLAAPDSGALIDLSLAPWRLPAEAQLAVALPEAVDDAWLFGSFVLSPADLVFLAAARTDGVAAVNSFVGQSPLAAVVAPAIVDGQVVPDKMLDQAAWLSRQIKAAMATRAGSEEGFHAPFARIGAVAALRAGMIVADANGQFRDAGVLRINALDRSSEAAADPVFLASVAAWDAGNSNALRAQELVHRLERRYPPLEAARYSLDALHLRTSRNAAPSAPVH